MEPSVAFPTEATEPEKCRTERKPPCRDAPGVLNYLFTISLKHHEGVDMQPLLGQMLAKGSLPNCSLRTTTIWEKVTHHSPSHKLGMSRTVLSSPHGSTSKWKSDAVASDQQGVEGDTVLRS